MGTKADTSWYSRSSCTAAAPVDVLQHVEPGQVVRRVERVQIEERRVRVEDRDELLVERLREARALDELQLPVDTHRRSAHVSLLARDLARQLLPRREVRADDDGIDPRAEVVDVRDRHHANAAVAQRRERARALQRLEQIAVAGRVQRRPPIRVVERIAGCVEAQRHELVEDERIAEPTVGDVSADGRIGREARHQRDRNAHADLALERRRLHELRFEEAHAVDGGQHRLHDAAEAGRHPAGEHDLRDLASAQRVEPGLPHVVVSGVARSRERE